MISRIDTTNYVRPSAAAGIFAIQGSGVDQLITSRQLPAVEIDDVRSYRGRLSSGEMPESNDTIKNYGHKNNPLLKHNQES